MKGADETEIVFRHGLGGAVRMGARRATDSGSNNTASPANYWIIALTIFCLWMLLSHLGSAALFEPDEGRNAEVAREILLLKDWVTPHYDFLPRMDKPISYFWLVALSFRLLGPSAWSARLPSALAALACLSLTYALARSMFGRWAALWSVLILLTSVEFFAYSRIVILDMVLTFFFTLTLYSFFLGQREVKRGKRRLQFSLMYVAMGAATLVKGPIGFLLPAAVISFHLLLAKRWALLRDLQLPVGLGLFVLTAAPWYLLAESRNPGYLRYFFWEENLARFATTRFNRNQPWYYFFLVVAAGFFPWTVLLPQAFAKLWKRPFDGQRLFLALWAGLPLLVFSLSLSKLPHYILPIYPPLAIIVGATVAGTHENSPLKACWLPAFPAFAFFLVSFGTALVALRPDLLPVGLQAYIHAAYPQPPIPLLIGLVLISILALWTVRRRPWREPVYLYPATTVSFALLVLAAAPITAAVATTRSSEQLADKAGQFVGAEDQLVLYEGYPSSLPYYLNIQRPIWVVWSGNKSTVLGSDYVALKRPEPAPGYGKVLYSYKEFAAQWKASKARLVVFVNIHAVPELERLVETPPRKLLQVRDTALVEIK